MFGNTLTKSQNEKTQFNPMSIYALEKFQHIIYVKCITRFMECLIVGQSFTIMSPKKNWGICNKKNCSSSL